MSILDCQLQAFQKHFQHYVYNNAYQRDYYSNNAMQMSNSVLSHTVNMKTKHNVDQVKCYLPLSKFARDCCNETHTHACMHARTPARTHTHTHTHTHTRSYNHIRTPLTHKRMPANEHAISIADV